jgi:hypothetical protein
MTELNQACGRWDNGTIKVTVGRQEILLGDQRYVGRPSVRRDGWWHSRPGSAQEQQRVSSDLGRTTRLRYLTVVTASGSFFSDEIRGTAKLPDERGIDFACTTERLRGSIVDVSCRVTEAEEQRALIVRCESRDNQRRECPVDTSGGVTLVRQLSRTPCQENVN